MAILKRLGGILGFISLLALCILVGVYASSLNASLWFNLLGVTGTLAGLGTGVGMGLVECSLIAWFMGEKSRKALKKANVPKNMGMVYHVVNLILKMSRDRVLLITVFILGSMPLAYWIARPLYTFSKFQVSLGDYMVLAWRSSPGAVIAEEAPQPEGVDDRAQPENASGDQAPADDTPERVLGKDRRGERRVHNSPDEPRPTNRPADLSGQASEAEADPAPKPAKPSHLPVRGKILPIDMDKHRVDPVYFDLSNNIRPRDPNEIGAIAALWWNEVQVGTYSGSNGAFQQHCTVMVWDTATKSLLAERSFVGGMPPPWSYHGSPESGSRPYAAIRDYLNGLPRR
jgi:hypothetical protein